MRDRPSAKARSRPALAPPAKPRLSASARTPAGADRRRRLVVDEHDVAARLARAQSVDRVRGTLARAPAHHDGARLHHRARLPARLLPSSRDRSPRAHHRHHRPGRLLPRRAAARQGLRGHRHRAPLEHRDVRADRAPRRAASSCSRPTCSTRCRCRRRCAARSPHEVYNLAAQSFVPTSWTQPVLTAEFTGRRRDAHARGDPQRRPVDPLLPGVVVGDVRQGAARCRRTRRRRSTRAARTASPRSTATSSRSTTARATTCSRRRASSSTTSRRAAASSS